MKKTNNNKSQQNKKKRIQKLKMINEEKKQLTKNSIIEALFILLNEKRLNEINVTDIVKKAGISRSSFYRYYSSTEEIIKSAVNTQTTEIKEMLTNNLSNNWLTVIKAFRKNKKYFTTLLKTDYIYLLLDTFNNQFNDNDYYHIGWSGFTYNILYMWIKNDMKESDEEIHDIIINCTKRMANEITSNKVI